jgi:hypothetical protein
VVEAQTDARFAGWLYAQLCEGDRVAAPDGSLEAWEFGAVNPLPGAVEVPWGRFEADPARAVSWLARQRPPEVLPAVLAEYDRGSRVVRLRWGRHVPVSRAAHNAVLLG